MNLYKKYQKAYKRLLRCKAKLADIEQRIQQKQEEAHIATQKYVSDGGVFVFTIKETASVPKQRVEKLRKKLTEEEFNSCFGVSYYAKASVLRDAKLRSKIKPVTRKRLVVTIKTEE